jgi:hypothetical protein
MPAASAAASFCLMASSAMPNRDCSTMRVISTMIASSSSASG